MSLNSVPPTGRNSRQSWRVCLVASLFFFYEFIQMNMMNPLGEDLMRHFGLNVEQLGDFSAYYFNANVIFLLPAAFMLDRLSTRYVILVALAICIVGNFCFSQAESIAVISWSRFLTGIGSAFCFLSCIRLASRWFSAHRLAFVSGVIVAIGMTGGSVAQWPVDYLRIHYGWREAILVDALFGCLVWLAIFIWVKDYPKESHEQEINARDALSTYGYLQCLKSSFGCLQNWLCGVFTCALNAPIFILGGLYGNFYLRLSQGYSSETCSLVVTGLFIGSTLGAPLFGWLSDRLKCRVIPMKVGAGLSLVSFLLFGLLGSLPPVFMFIIFLWLGLITSAQVLSYPVVAESSPQMLTATSVSVVSLSVISSGSILDKLFGFLVQHHHGAQAGSEDYLLSDFQFALWLIPILFATGYLITMFITEPTQASGSDS